MSDQRKHNHYFKDVQHLQYVDVYRVLSLFNVTDPCIQHATKKLLVAGGRGAGKDKSKDIQESIDSLVRWQQMRDEDGADIVLKEQTETPAYKEAKGEVLGAPYPSFPEWCTTFRERKAYQVGIADARRIDRKVELNKEFGTMSVGYIPPTAPQDSPLATTQAPAVQLDVPFDIPEKDIKVEYFRDINDVRPDMVCVRIQHIPSGIGSICTEHRTAEENRKHALNELKRLLVRTIGRDAFQP